MRSCPIMSRLARLTSATSAHRARVRWPEADWIVVGVKPCRYREPCRPLESCGVQRAFFELVGLHLKPGQQKSCLLPLQSSPKPPQDPAASAVGATID